MLSERSQTQKDKHCLIPLTGGPWRSQIHRNRKQMVGPGGGGGDGESAFHGVTVSIWEDEKVLEMMVGLVTQQSECV